MNRIILLAYFVQATLGAVVPGGFGGAADAGHVAVADEGPLPRHTVENEHVKGLLDHSNFTFVGRGNPRGPYSFTSRNWTDVYGYVYDGTNPDFQGRRYAYVSTGGFGRTGNFAATHEGGVAIFDVTDFGDPHYLGTYVPPCDTGSCNYLIRDVEIHDGIGYFSSDSDSANNGGVFVADLRPDPANPTYLAHLNSTNFSGLNDVHEIGLDVVSASEAFLYANDSSGSGRVSVYDVSDPRTSVTRVADFSGFPTHGVFAKDDVLYVSGSTSVTVFDVSDVGNGNVTRLGQFRTPGGFTHGAWPDKYVDGSGQPRDVLYVAHEDGGTELQVYDVTDVISGANPRGGQLIAAVTSSHLENAQGTGPVTNPHNLFLVGDVLFSSWTAAGMVVMDVTNPESPRVIDTFDTNPIQTGSYFEGDFGVNAAIGFDRVLISDRATGLWVVDVSRIVGQVLGGAVNILQPGDADQDLDFDQLDLVQVQVAAKYLTGQRATWGEGDWNGAPGGEPGNPPAGNGLFDQFDIVAALGAGTYLTGPYVAIRPGGSAGEGQMSIMYDANTGEVAVDAPAGTELSSIHVESTASIFTGDAARNLGGSFDNDADNNIFKATFGGSFGSVSFGNVAQAGLSEEFVLGDLNVVGSLAGGGGLGSVDLVYVPEPTSAVLLAVGLVMGILRIRN